MEQGDTGMESYYREQAASCARDADAATLTHVRERCRRSQNAWLAMAERAARTAKFKAANEG